MTSRLSRRDLEDIANGAAIYASGGGGSINIMQPLIDAVEEAGGIELIDLDEVSDQQWLAVVAGAGSASTTSTAEAIRRMLNASSAAFADLKKRVEKDLVCAAAIETGIGNTLIPMVVAARNEMPVVDGAGARRAVPELSMTTYACGVAPICPAVLANDQDYSVTYDVEPMGSDGGAGSAGCVMGAVLGTSEFANAGGIAMYTMNGETLRKTATPRAIKDARDLGRTLREAKEGGEDPVEAVCKALDGIMLVKRARLAHHESRVSSGLDFDRIVFEDLESSRLFRVFAANENLMAWNGRLPCPVAMGPDLICYLTRDGDVLTNADLEQFKEKEIAIIGARAQPQMRSEAIVKAFLRLLRKMNYGGPYVPIEQLQAITSPESIADWELPWETSDSCRPFFRLFRG